MSLCHRARSLLQQLPCILNPLSPREPSAREKLVSSLVVCIYPRVRTPAPTYNYTAEGRETRRRLFTALYEAPGVYPFSRHKGNSARTEEPKAANGPAALTLQCQDRQQTHTRSSSLHAHTNTGQPRSNMKKHAPCNPHRYFVCSRGPIGFGLQWRARLQNETHLEDVRVEAGAYLLHGEVVEAGQLVDGGAEGDVGGASRPGHSGLPPLQGGLFQCLAHGSLWNWSGRH